MANLAKSLGYGVRADVTTWNTKSENFSAPAVKWRVIFVVIQCLRCRRRFHCPCWHDSNWGFLEDMGLMCNQWQNNTISEILTLSPI